MIRGLAHVCFEVADLDASVRFYSERLGLRPAFDFRNERGERFGVYLKAGPRAFLELFQAGCPRQRPDGVSYRHVCFEVDDFPATLAALRGAGVEVRGEALGEDRSWQAWITDPDGNPIELHGYTPESRQGPHLDAGPDGA